MHARYGCPLQCADLWKELDRADFVVAQHAKFEQHWLWRLGWDPTLVRALYVVVSVFSAAVPGLLIYLVLWLVMPQKPS